VEAMREHAHAVLDEAVRLGLRYIDCARSYGLSEDFVASWMSRRDGQHCVVGSKWGYEYTAEWRIQVDEGEAHEVKKHTVEQLSRQLGESRALLPKLALYQIHSATPSSGVLENAAVLDALAALKAEGVDIGASVSHPQVATLEALSSIERGGTPLFTSVQATFNLLDQSAASALAAAAESGYFVIIKEALANGRLTSRAVGTPALQVLSREATALDTTVDALALAWVMTHPWVGMCLSGASTIEQLRSNADALRLAPLEPELHARLGEALRQDCEQYWADRKALVWN